MTPLIYTAADLGLMFGHDNESTTRKYLARLVADHGFPPPLPHAHARYPKAAVDAWLVAAGMKPVPPAPILHGNQNLLQLPNLDSLTTELERLYGN